jgi:radical SAM-linked protein
MMRHLIRAFRRAGIEMIYSKGFHPKPQLTFGPALGLGVASLGELVDARIAWDGDAAELVARLGAATPVGLRIVEARRLGADDAAVSRVIGLAEWAAWVPSAAAAGVVLRAGELVVTRRRAEKERRAPEKRIDVGQYLVEAAWLDGDDGAQVVRSLDWPPDGRVLRIVARITDQGGAKPVELVEALLGAVPPEATRYGRLSLRAADGTDPLDLEALARARAAAKACAVEAAV